MNFRVVIQCRGCGVKQVSRNVPLSPDGKVHFDVEMTHEPPCPFIRGMNEGVADGDWISIAVGPESEQLQ